MAATFTDEKGIARCRWCEATPLYRDYHDKEWGYPVDEDRRLFEKICLEGFQSGLSWLTILNKRENFRAGFANFEPAKVARFKDKDVERLLQDVGIVRHRGKIESTINNAQRALELQKEFGSLAAYFWGSEPDAKAISKDLKKRGWSFVGPTTVYAFMQAMGMVNDHAPECFAHAKAEAARKKFRPPKRPA
jgi:DNA-3-methyladenine glycosylase I